MDRPIKCPHCQYSTVLRTEFVVGKARPAFLFVACPDCRGIFKYDGLTGHASFPGGSGGRHIPLISGVLSFTAAVALVLIVRPPWLVAILATPFLIFGVMSFRTALSASQREISELTGMAPVTEETLKKLEDRF